MIRFTVGDERPVWGSACRRLVQSPCPKVSTTLPTLWPLSNGDALRRSRDGRTESITGFSTPAQKANEVRYLSASSRVVPAGADHGLRRDADSICKGRNEHQEGPPG